MRLGMKPPPVVRFEFNEHRLDLCLRVFGVRIAHIELEFGRRW